MRRMVLAALLLFPGQMALCDVPKELPAAIVVDPVAQVLQRFRRETDPKIQISLIRKFGHIRDPRVTVALMEVVLRAADKNWADGETGLLLMASSRLVPHHIPEKDWVTAKYWVVALLWWEDNEEEVQYRAGLLPK